MSFRTPLLVGALIVVAVTALSWFLLRTSEDQYSDSNTYVLYADFKDAAGIRWKTRVQVNGLDVGKIADIKHRRNEKDELVARVKLLILNEYEVFENARIKKTAESLLGDYRLDLDPGNAKHRKLEPEDVIIDVQSLSDLDAIQSQLKSVATNVNNVTESLSSVLAGPKGEGSLKQILESVERSMKAMESATGSLRDTLDRNQDAINQTVTDLAAFSRRLGEASQPDGEIKEIVKNLALATDKLVQLATSLNDTMEGTEAVQQPASVKQTLANLNQTLEQLADVTRKVNEGQGTVGRVINDSSLIEKVEETVDGANELLGGLSKLQTQIELRSEYGIPFRPQTDDVEPSIKNALGLRLIPKPDKYYLIEATVDPRGNQLKKTITTTEEGTTATTERLETTYDQLKFSVQFAKRYYFATFRFGIIENTGGLGLNLHAIKDRMELRFDAFDFARSDPERDINILPRLRGTALVEFVDHLWVQGGIDDPLNRNLRVWFLGGALRFTDDDLRSLIAVGSAAGP